LTRIVVSPGQEFQSGTNLALSPAVSLVRPTVLDLSSQAMSRLNEALAQLDSFLEGQGIARQRSGTLLFEIDRRVRLEAEAGAAIRVHIPAGTLIPPSQYQVRFDELLGLGYAWLNLSCYGFVGETMVVAVELPRTPAGRVGIATSINFSGPPKQGYELIVSTE